MGNQYVGMPKQKPALDILIAMYSGNVEDVRKNLPIIMRTVDEKLTFVKPRVTLAYNGAPPPSWDEMKALVKPWKNIRITSVSKPGKGNAILNNVRSTDSDIVAYMDADLATSITGLPSLIETVRNGADVSTGSRYHSDSKISRDLVRLFVSKVYTHLLLKYVLRVSFADPQCGFKAFKRKRCLPIISKVQDSWFFFETELLFLAERHGLKIVEIPVTWEERSNSSVRLFPTIIDFLKNMMRLLQQRRVPKNPPWKEDVLVIRDASHA